MKQADKDIILHARGLKKSFGDKFVLKGLDFSIRAGEAWTFFGPNGAGKTTLIKILAMLLKPTAGKLTIDKVPVERVYKKLCYKIGMVSHETFLYGNLTTLENLLFYGRLYEVENLNKRVDLMLNKVGLTKWAHERVRHFSRGMKQRLSIARAILHNPSILLLDEPFTGLDLHAIKSFQKLIASLHEEDRTIILTSHNLNLGLEICNNVAILANGRIVYTASKEKIKNNNFEKIYFKYCKSL